MLESINLLSKEQKIIFLILIFLGTWLLPRLWKRKQILRSSFATQQIQNSPSVNLSTKTKSIPTGKQKDIEQFLLQLMKIAKTKQMKIVYPGSLYHNGNFALPTMIVVGTFGIMPIFCFGYGANLEGKSSETDWKQFANNQIKRIPSPISYSKQQMDLIQEILEVQFPTTIPLYHSLVFTNQTAVLTKDIPNCYTAKEFLAFLATDSLSSKATQCDVDSITTTLVHLVKESKKQGYSEETTASN